MKFLKVSHQPKAAVEPGARHGSTVSRRELQAIVAMARHDLNALHRQNLRRIHWNVPNVAWAMDPCEYGQRDAAGDKVYLNQMHGLASRYTKWKRGDAYDWIKRTCRMIYFAVMGFSRKRPGASPSGPG